jgi:RIO-like serine/threonine protein kinase
MVEDVLNLTEPARIVFSEIKQHKAMPVLEIAAVTGIRGQELKEAVNALVEQKLVIRSGSSEWTSSIVSLSGRFY